jgi:hypothetical protein
VHDLSPEAVLARATKSRGDIFPEWKPLAYASPKTYHLINETVSYFHQYHGQADSTEKLSGPMRELIAIPALCVSGLCLVDASIVETRSTTPGLINDKGGQVLAQRVCVPSFRVMRRRLHAGSSIAAAVN